MHEGVMWVNEDIEIPIPDHPDWDNFKFKFIASDRMDSQEWAEFMKTEVKTLKSK